MMAMDEKKRTSSKRKYYRRINSHRQRICMSVTDKPRKKNELSTIKRRRRNQDFDVDDKVITVLCD